ncbi:homeobox domain-containing protein [Vararia minispora EC-137]|uniref:Homeobox domain-containing protein n=1 Tax=Vararia minispora EC-137 TaxID=1314806 RepID=A0ACB8QEG1_9AGAM|nr:homeobox domain-containing protein [Vararia minispora EC-137]
MFYSYVPNAVKTRKRTSAHQLSILEDVFVTDKKPNSTKRKDLSGKLNMTAREVQVWFQNRRAKEKKLAAQRAGQAASSPSATAVPQSGSEQGSPVPDDGRTVSASTSSPDLPSSAAVLDVGPKDPSPRLRSRGTRPAPAIPSAWPAAPLPSNFTMTTTRLSPTPVYEQRRSSLPAPTLSAFTPANPSFPSQMPVPQPSLEHHRRSVHALEHHSYASLARRASLADPRVNHRYHPWAGAQAQQRPSAPDIFNVPQPRVAYQQPSPAHDFPFQQSSPATPATPFDGWNNLDPFGTGAGATPDGHSIGLLGESNHHGIGSNDGVGAGPLSSYEFPPKEPLRQSVGSVNSVPCSDGSTSTSTGGPYFSDIPSSEDGDGRRGSCVSASDMLNTLSVGEDYRPRGSDFNGSDTNTVSYPSPPSDRGRSASVPTLPHSHPMPPPMERSASYSIGHGELASLAMPPAVEFHVRPTGAHGHAHSPDSDGLSRPFKYGDGPAGYAGEYASATPYGYGRGGYAAQPPPPPAFGEQQAFETHPHEYDAGGLQRFS